MSNCKNARKNMSAYIDNLLSQSEKLSFEEHIKKCCKCKKELAEFQEILSLTNNFNVQAPDPFTANVMQKIEKEAVHKKKFSLYSLPKYATAFAAVFLFAVVLKTPVMNYFEKSYIENENVQKQSTAYVTKADEIENNGNVENDINIENNIKIESSGKLDGNNEVENNNNIKSSVKESIPKSGAIESTTKDAQKQNSSGKASNGQKQAENEQNQENAESFLQYDAASNVDMALRIAPKAFDTAQDEVIENKKASGGGNDMQTADLMPNETTTIYTSITLDEAKIKLENALGYEVFVLNDEISLKLSNTEYKSLCNALCKDNDFEGFDNKLNSQSINVVIISKFSN